MTKETKIKYGITKFYTKQQIIAGSVVLSSSSVPNRALQEAAYLIRKMTTKHPELLKWLVKNNIRTSVMGPNEDALDVPEFHSLAYNYVWPDPEQPWWQRRGFGATLSRPSTLGAVENLLCDPTRTGQTTPPFVDLSRDAYGTESIFIHEFAHSLHLAIKKTNPTIANRISASFRNAKNRKLWKATYSEVDELEYFAEGTQSWFNANKKIPSGYKTWGVHNQIDTRAELKAYDQRLAGILNDVYGPAWTYRCP